MVWTMNLYLCLHVFHSGHNERGLIKRICQTLEYCWQPNVASCLVESLAHLVTDNEEYVAALLQLY